MGDRGRFLGGARQIWLRFYMFFVLFDEFRKFFEIGP